MNRFNDFDNEDIFQKSLEMMKEIQGIISANKDNKIKTEGDIVVPWDGSYLYDMQGNNSCIVSPPFIRDDDENNKCIVILTGNNVRFKKHLIFGENKQTPPLDLVICHLKSRNQYYIDSDSVKILTT